MESVEKVDLFMPLFVGDYLKDTGDLTAEEHGAYMLLMMHMWNRGGSLPLDHARLCRLAAVERERWPAVWGEIDRFFDVEAGRVTQKRVNAELEKARKAKADKARAGRQGGLASAAERHSRIGAGHQADGKQTSSSGQADTQADSNPPSPSPSPSPSGSPSGSPPHADLTRPPARAIPGPVPRAPDPPKPPAPPDPPKRARLSGYDLQHLFGQMRSAILGGMPWTIPPDAKGAASSFAERLTDDAVPDVEPTMRLMFERIRDRRKDWTDDRLREDASFAFGSWRSKFTHLRETLHHREPAGAPTPIATKSRRNGEHVCFAHREMPDKPASERDPLCALCDRFGARNKRWGDAEPVPVGEVEPR